MEYKETYNIGKFIAYRPDKMTVVIDDNGNLKEIPQDMTRKASHQNIMNDFNNKIKYYEERILGCQLRIEQFTQHIKSFNNKSLKVKSRLIVIEDEINKLEMVLALGGIHKHSYWKDIPDEYIDIQRKLNGYNREQKQRAKDYNSFRNRVELRQTDIDQENKIINRLQQAIMMVNRNKQNYLNLFKEDKIK